MPVIYEVVTPASYDLSNVTTCIPSEQFSQLLQFFVFKDDALKLGALCFVSGILFALFLVWLDHRWKK